MRQRRDAVLLLGLLTGISAIPAWADTVKSANHAKPQIAFPGAEGFGRFAQGGRGGDVYHVTALADNGAGSLRAGIRTAHGPRTIVFDCSGNIELKSPIVVDKSFLTIAGQTAPGDGICLKGMTFKIREAKHIVVRYIRVRLGDKNRETDQSPDAMTTNDLDHVIFDHITSTWGIDGNHDLRRGGNFTLQWSIYAEALNHSTHHKGAHAMLASFRDLTASITLHHNLFASSRERHPTLGGSPRTKREAIADFRNNVVFNWSGATNISNCRINFINNLYRPGLDTPKHNFPIASKTENAGALKAFLEGNVFENQPRFTQDNYAAIDFARWSTNHYLPTSLAAIRVDKEFDVDGARPKTDSAQVAFQRVLQSAGASLHRDAADARLVQGVRDRSGRLIDSQEQVGGWPQLKSGQPPVDTDQDGMPDEWEQTRGLDPRDPNDRNGDRDHDGFTNLEEYLNHLAS